MKPDVETVKLSVIRGRIGGMSIHKPVPELIELHHRYQCKECHSWIRYDEFNGMWWHQTKNGEPSES